MELKGTTIEFNTKGEAQEWYERIKEERKLDEWMSLAKYIQEKKMTGHY